MSFLTSQSMKSPILFFCIFLFAVCCNGQQDSLHYKTSNNVLYFEIGGWGGKGSINYERTLFRGRVIKFTGRLGYSIVPERMELVPFGFNLLLGNEKDNFEIGFGQVCKISDRVGKPGSKISFPATALTFGYRIQKVKGGVFFRIAFTPLIANISEDVDISIVFNKWQPWVGVSLGYSFKKKAKKF